MNENVIFLIGNIVMLDIIKKDYGYLTYSCGIEQCIVDGLCKMME